MIADECIEEVRRLASEGRFSELAGLEDGHAQRLRAHLTPNNPEPQHAHENQFIQAHTQKLQELESRLGSNLTVHQQVHEYLVDRIPTFIYMDDYKRFRGRADLMAVKEKLSNKKVRLTEEDETFLMILRLAGLRFDELSEQGESKDEEILHDRQLDLQDAATTLTRAVAGRWGQNTYRIEFRADGQVFFTDIEEVGKDIGMIPLEEGSSPISAVNVAV